MWKLVTLYQIIGDNKKPILELDLIYVYVIHYNKYEENKNIQIDFDETKRMFLDETVDKANQCGWDIEDIQKYLLEQKIKNVRF